jgi:hypothetical protein
VWRRSYRITFLISLKPFLIPLGLHSPWIFGRDVGVSSVDRSAYNKVRLTVIVLTMASNLAFSVISIINRKFPLGIAPILFLIPIFLRELDLRGGRPLRRFGSFEWSCFIAGSLFLAVLPLFFR